MHDIFLSYSKEDKHHAKILAQALEKRGFDVWWDINIPTGRTFDSVIQKAIDEARCVVVLWSKRSITSEWVHIEAAEGKKRNVLIPVLIEDVEIPLAFRRRQTAKLINWNKRINNPNFKRLLKDIHLILNSENSQIGNVIDSSIKDRDSFWVKHIKGLVGMGVVLIVAIVFYLLYDNKPLNNKSTLEETTIDSSQFDTIIPLKPIPQEVLTGFIAWPTKLEENFELVSNIFPDNSVFSSKSVKSTEARTELGKYRIKVEFNSDYWNYYPNNNVPEVEDFYASFDFKFVQFKDPNKVDIGFIFGKYGKAYYALILGADNYSRLYFYDGSSSNNLIGWQKNSVQYNPKEFNRLEILLNNRKLSFFINQKEVYQNFPIQKYRGGNLRLRVGGNNNENLVVDFDNFELKLKPEE